MFDVRMDSNLVDTLPNARHGLPVDRHQTALDSAQLVAGSPPSFWGKVQQILEGGPQPRRVSYQAWGQYTSGCIAPQEAGCRRAETSPATLVPNLRCPSGTP